jgi:hypothetical protein
MDTAISEMKCTAETTDVAIVEQAAERDAVEQGRGTPTVKRLLAGIVAGAAVLAGSFAGVGSGGPPEAAADHIIINPNTFCTWTDGTIGSPDGNYCRYWWGGYVWIYQHTQDPNWVYYYNTYSNPAAGAYPVWIVFYLGYGVVNWGYL